MTKTVRARYTVEFKQEEVRLVEGRQSLAAAARTPGRVEKMLCSTESRLITIIASQAPRANP